MEGKKIRVLEWKKDLKRELWRANQILILISDFPINLPPP
jgi:hypothetical protein